MRVRACNLGKTPVETSLVFSVAPDGTSQSTPLGTKTWSLAAEQHAEATLEIPAENLKPGGSGVCRVDVEAGAGIAPVAVNFLLQRGLQEQLAGRS